MPSPDRRVGRTHRRLKEALIELIREHGYDSIGVRDITERADVGRSTFYSHFGSKEDLLFAGFDEWLVTIADTPSVVPDAAARPPETDTGFRFSLPLLKHMREHAPFFQATIVGGSDARVRRKTKELLTEPVRKELLRLRGGGSAQTVRSDSALEAQAHAIVGAFLSIAEWWLGQSPGTSAEEIDAAFQETVTPRGRGGHIGP